MNFDRTSLDQAISNLENAQPPQKSRIQEVGDLVGQIIGASKDGDRSDSNSLDASAEFDQLTAFAIAGNSEIFAELVAAEKSSRQENQPTLLMSAVMAGKTAIVCALVAAGADVNIHIEQFFEFDALGFAIDKEYLEIVKILIAAGADLNWQTPMMHPVTKAVATNNVELLKTLLDAGATAIFESGFSPIVKAAEEASPEIIQLLLDAGCDINLISSLDKTPLISACLSGRVEVVRFLLNAGANPNLARKNGLSPLIAVFSVPTMVQAISNWKGGVDTDNIPERMASIIELLLEHDVDLNSYSFSGQTALMIAAKQGYTKIALALIKKGADINILEDYGNWPIPNYELGMEDGFAETLKLKTALVFAVENGHTEIVAELLKLGAEITITDGKNRLPIDIAIQEGYTEIIQLLQNAGAQAQTGAIESSPAALLGAAKQGNLDTLKSALQSGINPNTSEIQENRSPRHKTALMFAAERGHLKIVEYLILAGADVNLSDRPGKKLGKTPLMYAAESGHTEIAQLLLQSGAIVDAQDKRGQTALYYAVLEKKTEAIKLLLDYGADPHKKNWDGTPFDHATYSNKEIVSLIITHDPAKGNNISDRAKEEMLRSVSFSGDLGITRELIAQGVDINTPDPSSGWTALLYAASRGQLNIVQVLLAAGADVNIKNHAGDTALSEAVYWGHLDVVNLLLSAGAEVNGIDNEEGSIPLIKAIYFGRIDMIKPTFRTKI